MPTRTSTGKIATVTYVKAQRIISPAHEMKFLRVAAGYEHTAHGLTGSGSGNGGGAEHVGRREGRGRMEANARARTKEGCSAEDRW